jgi:hypothetical protein
VTSVDPRFETRHESCRGVAPGGHHGAHTLIGQHGVLERRADVGGVDGFVALIAMHTIVDRHAAIDCGGGVDRLSRNCWRLYSRDSAEPIDDGRQPIDEGRVVVDERRVRHTRFKRQTLELSEPEGAAERRSGHDVKHLTWTGVDDRAPRVSRSAVSLPMSTLDLIVLAEERAIEVRRVLIGGLRVEHSRREPLERLTRVVV